MKKVILVVCLAALLLTACAAQSPAVTDPPETTELPEETTLTPEETTELPEETTQPPEETTEADGESAALALAQQVYDRGSLEMEILPSEVAIHSADELQYYLGLDSAEGLLCAGAIDPMMSASPFSLVVVQCAPGADAGELADRIAAGVDPFKWVCVSAEDVRATVAGDFILLTMMTADQADEYIAIFLEIAK